LSEFSESYHLRSADLDDGVTLLQRAGLPGFVFRPEAGWVTLLAPGPPFVPNLRLVQANPSLLLRYFFAEDHGWGFDVYRGAFRVAAFEVDWDAEALVKHPCTPEALALLAPEAPLRQLREVSSLLNTDDLDQSLGDENAELFATTVGLTRYGWLSYAYALKDRGDPLQAAAPVVECVPRHPDDIDLPFKVRPSSRS